MYDWIPLLVDLGGTLAMAVLFVYYLQQRDQRQQELDEQRMSVEDRLIHRVEGLQQLCHAHQTRITSTFSESLTRIHDRCNTLIADQTAISRDMVDALAQLKAAMDTMTLTMPRMDDRYLAIQNKLDTVLQAVQAPERSSDRSFTVVTHGQPD